MTSVKPILLGIADRVSPRGISHPAESVDILGLRQAVVSHLYPFDICNYQLIIGFPPGAPLEGQLNFSMEGRPHESFSLGYKFQLEGSNLQRIPHQMVLPFSLRTDVIYPRIFEPGMLNVEIEINSAKHDLGYIGFLYDPAPPLPDDVQRAIESNPELWHSVRYIIQCNKCNDGITPVAGLKRPEVIAQEDFAPNPVWYKDLPDQFSCTCGALSLPLRYLRESMHYLLIKRNLIQADGTFANQSPPLTLMETERVLESFRRLIDKEPDEADVQTFIQSNPMLLAPFAARQLFFKPPILNRYSADFGVVTSRGELLLIEIERPGLKLFKTDGTQTHELTHAFGQTNTWHNEIIENRAAVLRCIKDCPTNITNTRYLVIAGRSAPYNSEALTTLLRSSGPCEFMTYDHLIENVRNAVHQACI